LLPSGLRLSLEVRGKEFRMRSEIRAKLDLFMEQVTAEGYGGHQERVARLIAQCRATLSGATGQLGPWEAQQRGVAEGAVAANFLRLALVAAQSALAISQLPSEEYDFGWIALALAGD
jgi:hypothetical protein